MGEAGSMKSNLTIADWVGIAGIVVVVLLAVQSRTNERLDRIEDQVSEVRTELYSLGQRVARIEALIERTSPPAAGKHGIPETK